jgi:hypothetical protein
MLITNEAPATAHAAPPLRFCKPGAAKPGVDASTPSKNVLLADVTMM